jgi:quercetin dioxygenase-like cupin family protein
MEEPGESRAILGFLDRSGDHIMRVTRISSDSEGETHFEDVDIRLEDFRGNIFRRSKPFEASSMSFAVFSGTLAVSWHTAPRKQAIIILNGEVDLAVSDGGKRRFGPGHVLLLEDTTGRGHTTHAVDGKEREEVWVALE